MRMTEWISVDDSMPKAYEDVFIWPRPDFGVEQFVGHFNPHATGKAYEITGLAGWFAAEYSAVEGYAVALFAKPVSPVSGLWSGDSHVAGCWFVSRSEVWCRNHGSYYVGKSAVVVGWKPGAVRLWFPGALSEGMFCPSIFPFGSSQPDAGCHG